MDEDGVAMQRPSIVEVVSDGKGSLVFESRTYLSKDFAF